MQERSPLLVFLRKLNKTGRFLPKKGKAPLKSGKALSPTGVWLCHFLAGALSR
jgi:hypothetical protein